MIELGKVKVIYEFMGDKKSASGIGMEFGSYIQINLNPSKRRTKFNTVLIPWNRVVKVIVLNG